MNCCKKECCCKKPNHSWIVLAAIAIVLLLLLLLLPITAFIGLTSTVAQTVAVGAAVTFNVPGPALNIAFAAPSTATIGSNVGGSYLVIYDVNVINTATEGSITNTFAVTVNGVVQPSTVFGRILAPGSTGQVTGSAIITIPAGASVQLINNGPDAAQLTNTLGTTAIVSANLNLDRVGP